MKHPEERPVLGIIPIEPGVPIKLPEFGTNDAACFDLFLPPTEWGKTILVHSSCHIPLHLGYSVNIPEGWEMKIYSRSGQGFKQRIRLVNCVGIIDSDYTGEIIVGLYNDDFHAVQIDPKKAIAQAQLVKLPPRPVFYLQELNKTTARGAGGFGSTDYAFRTTGHECPICKSLQVQTPSGLTCTNGHGFPSDSATDETDFNKFLKVAPAGKPAAEQPIDTLEEQPDGTVIPVDSSEMQAASKAAPGEAQEPAEIPEAIERMANDRYKVVPSHESMFHRWAVVAGTGTQQLYVGRELECQNMARKFAGAFLDGAFVAMQSTAPQPAPAPLSDARSPGHSWR